MAAAKQEPKPRTRAMAALRRLGRAWTIVIDQLLAEEGTTYAQYAVLYALSTGEARSGAELARSCGVSGPTMSATVTNLARGGFIARERDPAGGRAILARLTPAGRKLIERCFRHIDAVERIFVDEVSEAELRQTEDVLHRWAGRFEQLQEPVSLSELVRRNGQRKTPRR